MRRRYSNEDKLRIVELYNSGLSQSQVADTMGCSKSCVEQVLHKYNVEQRDKAYYAKEFDDVIEDQIVSDYYKDGMSIRELAKKYKCSTAPIISLFKRRGINFRAKSTYRKYSIDEHYFDNIDTEEKAYILGLLYADGGNCSKKNHYIVSLTLHPKDIDILEKIRFALKMESPIVDWINSKSGKTYKRINICSKHMVCALEAHGIVPRKSLVVTYPGWLREDLYRHFIRGLFDGDGSIQSDLEYINLCGSVHLMSKIKEILEKNFNANIRIYNDGSHHRDFASMFCSTRRDMILILHWMYDNSTISLDRKYQLYLQAKTKYGRYINDYYDIGLAT